MEEEQKIITCIFILKKKQQEFPLEHKFSQSDFKYVIRNEYQK